jgi:hypothetical protein
MGHPKKEAYNASTSYLNNAAFDYIDSLFSPSILMFSILTSASVVDKKPFTLFQNTIACAISILTAKWFVSSKTADFIAAHSDKIRLTTSISNLYFKSQGRPDNRSLFLISNITTLYLDFSSIITIYLGIESDVSMTSDIITEFKVPSSKFLSSALPFRKVDEYTKPKVNQYEAEQKQSKFVSYSPIIAMGALHILAKAGILDKNSQLLSQSVAIAISALSGLCFGTTIYSSLKPLYLLCKATAYIGIIDQNLERGFNIMLESAKLGTLVRNACQEGLTGNKVVAV